MQNQSLISLFKRLIQSAHLEEETKATLESVKTAHLEGNDDGKIDKVDAKQVSKDPSTQTIKIGHKDVTITKKWTVAKIKANHYYQVPCESGLILKDQGQKLAQQRTTKEDIDCCISSNHAADSDAPKDNKTKDIICDKRI